MHTWAALPATGMRGAGVPLSSGGATSMGLEKAPVPPTSCAPMRNEGDAVATWGMPWLGLLARASALHAHPDPEPRDYDAQLQL